MKQHTILWKWDTAWISIRMKCHCPTIRYHIAHTNAHTDWVAERERERESNLMDWCSVSLTASVIPLVFTHSIFTNRESLIKNNYHKYFISFVIFRKSKKKKNNKKNSYYFREKGGVRERERKRKN